MLPPVLKTAFLVHDSAPSGVWAADQATLEFLFQTVTSETRTLEIGAGLTTVLFALKGARHTCVAPVQAEVERIQAHCAREGIDCSRVQFVIDRSERALPQLSLRDLDLVFIDGRHGFPAPVLDWYYTAGMLRVGGHLLLDDTKLWSVWTLREFLASDPSWRLERDLPNTAIFMKVAETSGHQEWTEQPFVVRKTAELAKVELRHRRRQEALRLLREGKLLSLMRKSCRFLLAQTRKGALL